MLNLYLSRGMRQLQQWRQFILGNYYYRFELYLDFVLVHYTHSQWKSLAVEKLLEWDYEVG